jgi:putative DNA primase/helicase
MKKPIHIEHNAKMDLATGLDRMDTNWKNLKWEWYDYLVKISTTHRTSESFLEYLAAKPERQVAIKDIGAFFGGYLVNGKRKNSAVMHRTMLTLDIDFASVTFWGDFTLLYGCAAAIYSTHKHCPEKPRLRLIIPLNREVDREEYVAIARRVAGILGIELFDPTTFEVARIMFWPSTSRDGEYIFEYQDGEFLDADKVLATYRNWKDTSEWPVSARTQEVIKRNIEKQGDPTLKKGIIGAFCRVYGITDVIAKYLEEVYAPTDARDRYTFIKGTTTAGLVIYNEKFAFSHHGTDPVMGKECNAFDLVRLHKFGMLDEGSLSNRKPSYDAMLELASSDPEVRKLSVMEQVASAREDFNITDNEWMKGLAVDKRSIPLSSIDNIVLILRNESELKDVFGVNSFEQRGAILKDLPWRKVTSTTDYIADADDSALRPYLARTYNIKGKDKIYDGLNIVAAENAFHPVRDYLKTLKWDGVSRLDTLLIDFLGADDTPYTRAVTRKSFTAAVARIFQPGIKFDYMPVFVGKQGTKKSMLIAVMGRGWTSDSLTTMQGKEAYESLQGVWLCEIAELAGMKKSDIETVKNYISKPFDRYRVAYGHRVENHARQSVFFGSTNNVYFLVDTTGNRRFWPIMIHVRKPIKDVAVDLVPKLVDQLWAEAKMRYEEGEKLYLTPALENAATAVQGRHLQEDPRTGLIENYLETLLPDNWNNLMPHNKRQFFEGDDLSMVGSQRRNRVCIPEIYCELFGGHHRDMNRYNTKELYAIMENMIGWEESKKSLRFGVYGQQKGFMRIDVPSNVDKTLIHKN